MSLYAERQVVVGYIHQHLFSVSFNNMRKICREEVREAIFSKERRINYF